MSSVYSIRDPLTGKHFYFSESFDDDRYELEVLSSFTESINEVESDSADFARCVFKNAFGEVLTKEQRETIESAFFDAGFECMPDYIERVLNEMTEVEA